jgi:hypothetical protein
MKKFELVLMGFALSSTITLAGTAYAKVRRLNASICAHGPEVLGSGTGMLENTSSSDSWVTCPLPEDDRFLRAEVEKLHVHVRSARAAAACVLSLDRYSMACGSVAQSPGAGYTMLTPGLEKWHEMGHGTAVVNVSLMPSGGGLYGLFIGD